MGRSPSDADVAKDIAHAGNASSANSYVFEYVDAGAGPRALPAWLAGANIRWNFNYSNRPELELCFRSNPLEGIRYRKDAKSGKGWFGSNPAGDCFETHWHSGVPAMAEFERNIGWDTADGKYAAGATMLKEPYQMLATHQERGYAGRHFDIVMADDSPLYAGQTIRLRGPWHGGTGRADTVAVVGVVWDDRARQREAQAKPRYRRGWVGATKSFGYNILERTFIDALATFFPHCPIARVTSGPDREGKTRTWIEPCLPQTQAPRFMTLAQLREPMEKAA
jgi:hypothetical protein